MYKEDCKPFWKWNDKKVLLPNIKDYITDYPVLGMAANVHVVL